MKSDMTRYPLLALLFAMTLLAVQAQPLKQSKAEDLKEYGYIKLEDQDYVNAVGFLEEAHTMTEETQLAYDIARSYEGMRDYKLAERWYKKVHKEDQSVNFPDAQYRYARMLKAAAKYEDAKQEFYSVLTSSENDSIKELVRNELLGISLALTSEEPLDISIVNAGTGINSPFSEYSPALYEDETFYFGGYNRKEMIIQDGSEDDYHAKIYTGKLPEKSADEEEEKPSNNRRRRRSNNQKKGGESTAQALGTHINREDYHTSNVSFSADGSIMYFTRAQLYSNKMEESQIYMSRRVDGEWAPPDPVPTVNGDYLATHPIEGELFGEKVLYFSSDMPGGYGGMDIYYSTIRGGEYGIPVNVGKVVNTSGDDITPYYQNGRLYFSSDGHPSMGGFDIFSSQWDGSEWSVPANLGKGFNTSMDDTYFRIDESGYEGFLVSNRPGTNEFAGKATCCDDIYVLSKKEMIIDLLAGTVNNKNEALTGATLKLIDVTDGYEGETKVQFQERDYLFSFPLERDREYKVVATREGYAPDSLLFNTMDIVETTRIEKKISLDPLPAKEDKDDNIVTRNETIRLNNIYYDFDDDKILPDAEKDLDILLGLLQKYPTMVIELSSHTDAQGNDDYNGKLSQSRANSAKKYLVNKGVNPDRIEARGYGEQYILNKCKNGVDCTDDEHRYNRRTEFKMIAGPEEIEINTSSKSQGSQLGGDSVHSPSWSTQGPIMEFENKVVDLGTIKYGETAEYTFSFVNVGSSDLKIEHASACVCTTVDYPVLPIAPGAKGQITILYDSTKKEGDEAYGPQEVIVDMITNTANKFEDVTFNLVVEK